MTQDHALRLFSIEFDNSILHFLVVFLGIVKSDDGNIEHILSKQNTISMKFVISAPRYKVEVEKGDVPVAMFYLQKIMAPACFNRSS